MEEWNKNKLLSKYPIKNSEYSPYYVIGYGDEYWYPGMKSQIVTFNKDAIADPWNRGWEDGTSWQKHDAYKDVLFRWVTVEGKKIPIYCVKQSNTNHHYIIT